MSSALLRLKPLNVSGTGLAPVSVLYVNINDSSRGVANPTGQFLRDCTFKAWPVAHRIAKHVDLVVPTKDGAVFGAFENKYTFETPDETYMTKGGRRNRVGFILGDEVPVPPIFRVGVADKFITCFWTFWV